MRQLSQSTDIDSITAFLSSPPGTIELPDHLERRANVYTLIASLLVEYPFKSYDEIQQMVIKTYPELTKGSLYSYIRDTKAIYGQLDKIDRGFERVLLKAQIGKALTQCYKNDDMRAVPKLLELWIKLYRLDKPDIFIESPEEMKNRVINNFYIQLNEIKIDDTKTVDLDAFIEEFEAKQING